MSGKKFILLFSVVTIISAVGISLWIKHGYETRPELPPVVQPNTTDNQ
jgi:hypothetical protein